MIPLEWLCWAAEAEVSAVTGWPDRSGPPTLLDVLGRRLAVKRPDDRARAGQWLVSVGGRTAAAPLRWPAAAHPQVSVSGFVGTGVEVR